MSLILGDIQTAYYTAAQWSAWNGILKAGQRGIESDTLKEKVGDGVTVWNSLSYLSAPNYDLQAVLTAGNSSGNLSAKFGTGTVYFGATNQTHATYNAGLELHNTTANTLVNLTDAGLWKVDATQYMPNLTASRILSLDASKNVVTSYTTTGSGTEIALSTSPIFVADITTPLIIGGTAVGSTIQYKGTTGIGTSTVAAHQFLVGTNGGTTAASIYNSGQVNIGNYATPSAQRLVTIGQDTAYVSIGSWTNTTSEPAIYANQATPSTGNYSIRFSSTSTVINSPASTGSTIIMANNGIVHRFWADRSTFGAAFGASTGAVITFDFTNPAHTGQTASTEIPNFKITGNTKTWATGALATQRFNWFTANTAAANGASTFTAIHNFYSDAPLAGSNMTATNLYAAGFGGHVFIANSVGVPSNNPTGGGVLYVESGALKYRGSSGTITTLGAA